MAPLYKRYIPPDDEFQERKEPEPAIGLGIQTNDQEDKHRKRKRVDNGQEKARKARKADRSEVVDIDNEPAIAAVAKASANVSHRPSDQPQAAQDGGFAHIKSSKKRHKLEKEARKARKLASQVKDGDVVNGAPQGVTASDHSSVHPVVAASKALQNAVGQHVPIEESYISDTDEDMPNDEEGSVVAHAENDDAEETNQISEDEDISDHDEAYLKKHASVLVKFEKSKKRSEKMLAEENHEDQEAHAEIELPTIKDLAPFGVELEDERPKVAISALPEWLAKPTIISQMTNKPFRELGLTDDTSRYLAECGFEAALPVQQALLPDLLPPGCSGARFLPGTETILPDIAVSAPTGSGKTLAYLLPMIESLKLQQTSRGIAGLIIVPTRELATQVTAVAVQLAKETKIRVGTASGGNKLADEQRRLMKISYEYDPSAYNNALEALSTIDNPPAEDSFEMYAYMESIDEKLEQKQYFLDTLNGNYAHVPRYDATCDVLVCTPGRLLEHIAWTSGFNLSDVKWLVLDEADKLLDEQYVGLLDTLNKELTKERPTWMRGARENYLRKQSLWNDAQERAVRKVVLSATMTKDVSKLASLQLKRPKLVVIGTRGEESSADATANVVPDPHGEVFELPKGLQEYYCPVGLGEHKPVQLLHLLETRMLSGLSASTIADPQADHTSEQSSGSDSDSGSESDESNSSSSTSDGSASASDSDTSIDSIDGNNQIGTKLLVDSQHLNHSLAVPTILVFTASTEAALRLTQLLKSLRPDLETSIRSITKTNIGTTLAGLSSKKPCIVVATDRAGRGLDTIAGRHITHVIQYDVPRSIVMYVHRVGRTARAGRQGQAWTLYTRPQARWFIKDVIKAPSIQRAAAVRKIMIEELDEGMLQRYDEALAGLRKQVFAKRS